MYVFVTRALLALFFGAHVFILVLIGRGSKIALVHILYRDGTYSEYSTVRGACTYTSFVGLMYISCMLGASTTRAESTVA